MQLPEPDLVRDRVARYAELIATRQADFGSCPLVLPNGHFFPDTFTPNATGVQRLLTRMQKHASLTDVPIALEFDSEEPTAGSSCGSGGGSCGLPAASSARAGGPALIADEHGWILRPQSALVQHPVALTTSLARMLGAIFVEETRPTRHTDREPPTITAEIAAVALGFGVLLLEGSHVYSKSCGGPQVACLTELSCGELAILTAVFAAHRRHSLGPAKRASSPTQAALLSQAAEFCEGNPHLARALSLAPSDLAEGNFELKDPNGASGPLKLFTWIRSWSSGRSEDEFERALANSAKPLTTGSGKRTSKATSSDSDQQLKALVENVLAESRD